MKKLFADTRLLDRAAVAVYGIPEVVLMENAAMALESAVREHVQVSCCSPKVLIITGSGNNGADGMALARRLAGSMDVCVYMVKAPKSEECIRQRRLAEAAGVRFIEKDCLAGSTAAADCIVDCLFGSGFHGSLDQEACRIIRMCNDSSAYRIACDIPSGVDACGCCLTEDGLAFCADTTVTMGALKTGLYSEDAKDVCGDIRCADLGVCRQLFEQADPEVRPQAWLLEESDIVLPERRKRNVNKGSFGHAVIVSGEKQGASVIAGRAAFAFGAGLVTLLGPVENGGAVPEELMVSTSLPAKTSAVAVGMGLGKPAADGNACRKLAQVQDWFTDGTPGRTLVVDADMCSYKGTPGLLELCRPDGPQIILTPHPKEFQSLLSLCGFGDLSVTEIIRRRLELAASFAARYKGVVLLLKGANTVIAGCEADSGNVQLYINPLGMPNLAKGGSGDVLSGVLCALLAQGYPALTAAITGTIAHASASRRIATSYGLTPGMLIEQLRFLEVPAGRTVPASDVRSMPF